jgi:DNA uptake protein ComE-like DNA-binding protein
MYKLLRLLLSLILCLSFAFGKDMTSQTFHYNFSLYMINALGSIPTECDGTAKQDTAIEWMCAYYSNGFDAFKTYWDSYLTSETIATSYKIQAITDWQPFNNEDGTLDFYAKTYSFENGKLIAAYDLSEAGREIFIGFEGVTNSVQTPSVNSSLNSNNQTASTSNGCININTANFEELRRIIHIDVERAQSILRRREVTPFTSVDDLDDIKGIGDVRLQEIKEQGAACVE